MEQCRTETAVVSSLEPCTHSSARRHRELCKRSCSHPPVSFESAVCFAFARGASHLWERYAFAHRHIHVEHIAAG
eukprot:2833209-Prymnesium_polylepis.2